MTTVAEIAKEAFDAVAAEFTDVIQTATLTRPATDRTYNASSGAYEGGTDPINQTGRGLIGTAQALKDTFPAHVAGPTDTLIYLEGFTTEPKENDKVTIAGVERTIANTGDIVGVGTFFAVVAK